MKYDLLTLSNIVKKNIYEFSFSACLVMFNSHKYIQIHMQFLNVHKVYYRISVFQNQVYNIHRFFPGTYKIITLYYNLHGISFADMLFKLLFYISLHLISHFNVLNKFLKSIVLKLLSLS